MSFHSHVKLPKGRRKLNIAEHVALPTTITVIPRLSGLLKKSCSGSVLNYEEVVLLFLGKNLVDNRNMQRLNTGWWFQPL